MSEISSLELTAGVAVASVAISAFTAFCPPLDKLVGDDKGTYHKTMEFGQNAAGVATLSVGAVLAVATKSPMPLMYSAAIALMLMFVYEFAERKTI